jgi:hypothetical protein
MNMSETISVMERFISRFYSSVKFIQFSITENTSFKHLDNFNKLSKNKQKLELYHCTRNYNYQENVKSIFDDGLFPGSACNKGYGIYLASHSNYSLTWGGGNHVFVCEVIADETLVHKYISEIYSPKNSWEYVVDDRYIIYPKYLIEYKLERINNHFYKNLYTNATCENCPEYKKNMEECYRRCDCRHFPIVEEENLITFSDDDLKNVETIKKHFEKKPDNIVQPYLTAGGKKIKY